MSWYVSICGVVLLMWVCGRGEKVNAMNCILKLWVVYIVDDILGGDNSDLDVEFESC